MEKLTYDQKTNSNENTFLPGGFLSVHKILIKKFGLIPAVLLSDYLEKNKYFRKNNKDNNNWFYLIHKQISDELQITDYSITQAKKLLISQGLINIERRGIPSKEWIKINHEVLFTLQYNENLAGQVPMNSPVLDSMKTKGLDPVISSGHNNIKYNNIKKINNNIKLHSPEQNSGEIDSSKSKKLSIVERNKQCLPICSKLSQIIRSKKNIKHTPTQLRSWSNEIRKLIEGNKISADRINQVLDWYKGTIGEKYIPVIESGASLREKFTRLEDAMKRDTNYIEEDYNPDEILESHFDSDWLLGVMKSNYERVCQFAGKDDEAELARSLCSLYDWIKGNQDPDVLTKVNDNINPSGLIRQYIAWLNDQAWLDNEISSQTFSPKNNLFRKMFLGDKNKELNIDVLTGKFIPSYESR
jgi:hypothetical protein